MNSNIYLISRGQEAGGPKIRSWYIGRAVSVSAPQLLSETAARLDGFLGNCIGIITLLVAEAFLVFGFVVDARS